MMFKVGDRVRLKNEITPEMFIYFGMDLPTNGGLNYEDIYVVDKNRSELYQNGFIALQDFGCIHRVFPAYFFEKAPEPVVVSMGRYVNHYLSGMNIDVEHCLLGYYLVEWEESCDHVRLIYQDRVRTEHYIDGKTKEECISKLIHMLSGEESK